MTKISQYPADTAPDLVFEFIGTDPANTSQAATGTTETITLAELQQYAGGALVALPSNDATGATDPGLIQAAANIIGSVALMAGAQYFLGGANPVTLGASQSLAGNWATCTITSTMTAAEAFILTGQGASIKDVFIQGASTTTTSNPACDGVVVFGASGCRVGDIRGQYVNGRLVKGAVNGAATIADLMIGRVIGRNCAALLSLTGAAASGFLGEVFLGALQGQQMGVTTGPNANLDAVLISDIGDVLGSDINIGMAAGANAGRAVHITGACATVDLKGLDVGANAVSGGVASVHVDAATGNGTPSGVRLAGSAQGGLYCAQVDAGADVKIDMRLHGAYASGLKVSGTSTVEFAGKALTSNQGAGTAYDVDGSGMTAGGELWVSARLETAIGTGVAGQVPQAAAVTSQCWFVGTHFAGSGVSPSTCFSGTPQQVINCPGYNPRGSVSAPTVGASPYTPGSYQTALMVIFTAVNGMTQFSIGGTAVPLPVAGVPYFIGVRQSMTITWATTAPTWQWLSL